MLHSKGATVQVQKSGVKLTSFLSQSGELNANSRKDAFAQQKRLLDMQRNGQLFDDYTEANQEALASMSADEIVRARRELVIEAMADPTGQKWASLGSSIVARIEDRAERTGIMRSALVGSTLRDGEIARVELKQHVSKAIVATGPSDLGYQVLRGKVFNPAEFEMKSHVRVSRIEMAQVAGDLLDRAQRDASAALIVGEDRLFIDMLRKSVGRANPMTYLYGSFVPGNLSRMRDSIESWNIPVAATYLSSDFWNDIIESSAWAEVLEPVTKYELIATGRLASLMGMDLITDGFRDPTQRVLDRGTMFTVSQAEYLGAYTTRGAPVADPVTGATDGNTDKGWLMSQIMSMVVANCRSVSMAQRK